MELSIECQCGSLEGTVDTSYAKGYRAICLCDDCQAYAHYLKRADILDPNGGTDIFPLPPAQLKITRGREHLRSVRLSPQGMFRWFAGCCQSPIGNTMPTQTMPYMGVVHSILEKKNSAAELEKWFGPVRARMQGQYGIGKLPPNTLKTVSPSLIIRVLKFIAITLIRGKGRPSPFFNDDGKPEVQTTVLSKMERDILRPLCGDKREV